MNRFHRHLLCSVLAVFALGQAEAANIYRCKNKDGSVVVSNTPCAKGAEPDAKLSRSSGGTSAQPQFGTACERVEATGAGLVQIRGKLTTAQRRAVDAEQFGRINSAGASRVLAEVRENGLLRVCGFFPGGGTPNETVIDTAGQVRHVDEPVVPPPAESAAKLDGLALCTASIDTCRTNSALGDAFENCVRSIPVCGGDAIGDSCTQACIDAYWKPPYEHQTGLVSMQNLPACRAARSP